MTRSLKEIRDEIRSVHRADADARGHIPMQVEGAPSHHGVSRRRSRRRSGRSKSGVTWKRTTTRAPRMSCSSRRPGFDWQAFLEPAGLGSREKFVARRAHGRAATSPSCSADADVGTLKDYLTVPLPRHDHARYLPKRFDDARFAFYGKTLRGQPEQRERWKRGVDAGQRRARRAGRPGLRARSTSRPSRRRRWTSWSRTCSRALTSAHRQRSTG